MLQCHNYICCLIALQSRRPVTKALHHALTLFQNNCTFIQSCRYSQYQLKAPSSSFEVLLFFSAFVICSTFMKPLRYLASPPRYQTLIVDFLTDRINSSQLQRMLKACQYNRCLSATLNQRGPTVATVILI